MKTLQSFLLALTVLVSFGCEKDLNDFSQCDHVLVTRITSSSGADEFVLGNEFVCKYEAPGPCFVDLRIEYRFLCGIHPLVDINGSEVVKRQNLELLSNSRYDSVEIPASGITEVVVIVYVNDDLTPSFIKSYFP